MPLLIVMPSKCIIQDNHADKEEQISFMPNIYSGADVTISAACSRSTSEGFLESRTSLPNLFRFNLGQYKSIHVSIPDRQLDGLEPLDSRGWALQEAILSKRILHFRTTELGFECSTNSLNLNSSGRQGDYTSPTSQLTHWSRHILSNRTTPIEYYAAWRKLVEGYSQRVLTISDDRLLAISGLANRFSNLMDSNYSAGIWESDLLAGLMWICVSPRRQPLNERAPSWSWAAIDGPVSFDMPFSMPKDSKALEYFMTIHSASVTPARLDAKFGAVYPGGHICVSGFTCGARIIAGKSTLEINGTWRTSKKTAKLFFDYVDSDKFSVDSGIYLLNFESLKNPLEIVDGPKIYAAGLMLVRLLDSDDKFKRIGVYISSGETDWFSNSRLETLYIY
jgi:hypothetical protein